MINTFPVAGTLSLPSKPSLPFHQNRLPVQFPAGANWSAWPYTAPPSPPPSDEVIEDKLSTQHALAIGTQYGAAFGAIGALPIWAIERSFGKHNFYSSVLAPTLPKVSKYLARPGLNFVSSIAATVAVGSTMGFFVGWMLVGDVRKRLLEINAVQQAQAQGRYTPHKPSILSRLGLHPKPVNDPQQAYYDLKQNNLNPQNAFWHGVLTILILKFLKGVVLPTASFGIGTQSLRLLRLHKYADWITEKTKSELQLWMQPVVIAKLALAPLMGGLIAQQLAPWMKRKLGITD